MKKCLDCRHFSGGQCYLTKANRRVTPHQTACSFADTDKKRCGNCRFFGAGICNLNSRERSVTPSQACTSYLHFTALYR